MGDDHELGNQGRWSRWRGWGTLRSAHDQFDVAAVGVASCTLSSLPRRRGRASPRGVFRMHRRLRPALGVLFAACVLLSGCSAGSGVNTETVNPPSASGPAPSSSLTSAPADSTAPAAGTSSPVSSSVIPSAAESTDGLTAQEAADRAAVEAQWVKSWDVYLAMAITPAAIVRRWSHRRRRPHEGEHAQRRRRVSTARACRPTAALGHRISWPQPINGAATAVIDDCQDRSQAGL